MDALFADWPTKHLTPAFKLYYLLQIAFWLQCILALNVEAKRKDYLQMFGHHILTSALLIGSYSYHVTRVGHVILTLMDFADIWLPVCFVRCLTDSGCQNAQVYWSSTTLRWRICCLLNIMGDYTALLALQSYIQVLHRSAIIRLAHAKRHLDLCRATYWTGALDLHVVLCNRSGLMGHNERCSSGRFPFRY